MTRGTAASTSAKHSKGVREGGGGSGGKPRKTFGRKVGCKRCGRKRGIVRRYGLHFLQKRGSRDKED